MIQSLDSKAGFSGFESCLQQLHDLGLVIYPFSAIISSDV